MKKYSTSNATNRKRTALLEEPRFFSLTGANRVPLSDIHNVVPTESSRRLSKRIRGPSIKYAEYADVPKNLAKASPAVPPVVIPSDFCITHLTDIEMGGEDKSLLQTGRFNTFSAVQFSKLILEKYGENISERFGIRRGKTRFYATDPKTLSIPSDQFAEAAAHQTLGELRAYLHLSQHECVPRLLAFWIDKEGHLNMLMEKYSFLLHQLVDVRSQGNMPTEEHMVALYELLQKLAKAGHFHDDLALDNIVRDEDGRFRFLDPGEISLMAEEVDSPLESHKLSDILKEDKIPEQFIAVDHHSMANMTCNIVDGKFVISYEKASPEGPRIQELEQELQDSLFSLLEFKFGDLWRRTVIHKLNIPIPPRDQVRKQSWERICKTLGVDFEGYKTHHPHHSFFKDSAKAETDKTDESTSLLSL